MVLVTLLILLAGKEAIIGALRALGVFQLRVRDGKKRID
jgi:hypothetical protein